MPDGSLLRDARNRRGWSRKRLADELCALIDPDVPHAPISEGQIGRWERGESKPTDYWIERLCTLYQSPPTLLGLYTPSLPLKQLVQSMATAPVELPSSFRSLVPPLPPHGVYGREEAIINASHMLQLEDARSHDTAPLVFTGTGGLGKTTLAKALARYAEKHHLVPDGILWAELGRRPNLRSIYNAWALLLGVNILGEYDEVACQSLLRLALHEHQALLIIDDIWEAAHGLSLQSLAGPQCRVLLTTRNLEVAYTVSTSVREFAVPPLSPAASIALLGALAPSIISGYESLARQLCEKLDFLPLRLVLAGRLLALEAYVPSRLERLLTDLIEHRDERIRYLSTLPLEIRAGVEGTVTLWVLFAMSVDLLPEGDRQRFAQLSLFGGEPLTWSLPHAQRVWRCSQDEAEATIARMVRLGLVMPRYEGQDDLPPLYWTHLLLADYAAELYKELQS